jgi:hypothetical protein
MMASLCRESVANISDPRCLSMTRIGCVSLWNAIPIREQAAEK